MSFESTIRDIRDGDVEAVIALWHACGLVGSWNDPQADIATARRDPHSTVLVAERDGGIAATVMVGEDGHRGWVYYVATAPEHQGQGFGRVIMRAAEKWLAERGIPKLNLLIRAENAGVRRFYERIGYADTRAICLQKVLSPAGA